MDKFCLNCGYCLHNLTAPRCPECAGAFDPADPKTYAGAPTWLGRLYLRILRFPAWPFCLAACGLFGAQFWFERLPFSARLWHIPWLWISWLSVACAWLLVAAVFPLLARWWRVPAGKRPTRRLGWWLPGVLAAAALAMSYWRLAFPTAFLLSRPFLSNLVMQAQNAFPTWDPLFHPKNAGMFPVTCVYGDRQTTYIFLDEQTILVHALTDKPDIVLDDVKHLSYADGHWFLMHGSCDMSLFAQYNRYDILEDIFLRQDASPQAVTGVRRSMRLPDATHGSYFGRWDQNGALWASAEDNEMFLYFDDEEPKVPELRPRAAASVRTDVQVMARLGKPAVPALVEMLRRREVPAEALGALGLIGPDAASAAPEVAPFLKDPDAKLRAMAAWALRMIDSPACTQAEALLAGFDDADPEVTFNILLALEKSGVPVKKLTPIYAAYWHRHAMAQVGTRSEFGQPDMASIEWIILRICRSGPEAAGATGEIAGFLRELTKRYERDKYTGENVRATDMPADYHRYLESENSSARMLMAIGPAARSASPAVMGLLNVRIRNGEIGSSNYFALLKALRAIDPAPANPPEGLVQFCLDKLAELRAAAVDEAKPGTPEDRVTREFHLRSYAQALQALDPGNAAIRALIAEDLSAPIDSPRRAWGVELAAILTPETLMPTIRDMIGTCTGSSLGAALRAAVKLHHPELLAALQARIARDPDALNADPFLLKDALFLLLHDVNDDPKTTAFVLQSARRYPKIFEAAINPLLSDMGNKQMPAFAKLAADWQTAAPDALPLKALARRLDLWGDRVPDVSDLVKQIASETNPAARAKLVVRLSNSTLSHPPPDLSSILDILEQFAGKGRANPPTSTSAPVAQPAEILTAQFDAAAQQETRREALRLLVAMPWSDRLETFLQTNLASSNSDVSYWTRCACYDLRTPEALPWLMKLLDLDKEGRPNYLADAAMAIAVRRAVPTGQLWTLIGHGGGNYGDTLVKAITHATGTDADKAQLLAWVMQRGGTNAGHPEAIAALLALPREAQEPARSALLHLAYGSVDETVRRTAREALAK